MSYFLGLSIILSIWHETPVFCHEDYCLPDDQQIIGEIYNNKTAKLDVGYELPETCFIHPATNDATICFD